MNELDYSVALDVHTWSEHPEVNKFVDHIYDTHFNIGNANIQKRHIKVVLLHLYVTWCDDPELKTAYSRNVNDYKAGSRYNALHISKLTIDVVDRLIEVGLVDHKIGFYDHETGIGRWSRMWPTDELIKMFQDAKFGPFDVTDAPDRETIILRDDEGEDIEYDDTAETWQMREVVQTYNDLISRTYIDIPTLPQNHIELGVDAKGNRNVIHVNQRDKFTRRIFNRGSFDKGGRFFGGWWQRCPKKWRHDIFLNDHPVSEIDYSGLHIVILYANIGIDYWEELKSDPYDISEAYSITNTFSTRDLCKQLLLVALNAKDDKATFKAFRNEAETGSPEKHLTDEELSQILDALREKHNPIAHMIANDAGIDLMNQDSQIAEQIIWHFTGKGIPILCIHDSFLVPFGLEAELHQTMTNAFSRVTGIQDVKLKQETHNPRDDEPLDGDSAEFFDYNALDLALRARSDPVRSERYARDISRFQRWLIGNGQSPSNFDNAVKEATSPLPPILEKAIKTLDLDALETFNYQMKLATHRETKKREKLEAEQREHKFWIDAMKASKNDNIDN